MKLKRDVGNQILKIVNEKREVDIDFLAFQIGSTFTQVKEEAMKLQDLSLIQVKDTKLRSVIDHQKTINWDNLKK